MKYKLRVFDGTYMYDVPSYEITQNDVIMKTGIEGRTLSLADTKYIIVLPNEKATLLKTYEDDGQWVCINKVDYDNVIKFKESKPGRKLKPKLSDESDEPGESDELGELNVPETLELEELDGMWK